MTANTPRTAADHRAALEGRIGMHLGAWDGRLDVAEERGRFIAYLADFIEAAAAPTPAEPQDECPCGHDENEHVHYCSAITDTGQSCHCVQEYVRLAEAER